MSRAVRNSLFLLVGRLVPLGLALLKVAVLSRLLGIDLFGRYSLLVAFATIGELALFTGIRTVIPRETARDPERARLYLLAGCVAAGVLASLGIALGWWVVGAAFGGSEIEAALRLVTLSWIPSAFVAGGEAALAGLERMETIARNAIAEACVVCALSVTAVLSGGGLLALAGAIVVGRGVAVVSTALAVRTQVGAPRLGLARGELRRVTLASASYSAIALLALVHFKIDLFLLAKLRGDHDAGLYAAAYRFLELLLVYPAVIVSAVYPRLAAIPPSAPEEFGRTAGGALAALWLPLLPLAAITCGFSGDLLAWLFGPEYRQGAPALRILIWAALPYALDQVLAYSLIARGRHFFAYWVNAAGLALNVGLNLWLIPRLGGVGCAVATLASLSLIALLVAGVSAAERLPLRPRHVALGLRSLRGVVYG